MWKRCALVSLLVFAWGAAVLDASQEKQTRLNFSVAKGGLTGQQVTSLSEDLAGSNIGPLTQTIPTNSWVAIDIGSCSSADLMLLRNTDVTNYVQLSVTNDGTRLFARLTPGRVAFFPVEGAVTIYAKAHYAATNGNLAGAVLQKLIVEP